MRPRKTTRGGHPAPCWCEEVCLHAEREYAKRRRRLLAYGRWEPFTDAGMVREHVRALAGFGISPGRLSAIADVPPATLEHLLYGQPARGLPPSKRIRTGTAQRLLAVQPAEEHLAGGVPVDAAGTRRRVQALAVLGWSEKVIAQIVDIAPPHLARVVRGEHEVTAATARRVRAAYARLWDQAAPETTTGERISAAKARAHAARHGWAPPLAWDDDEIDNPAAQPYPWKRSSFYRAGDLAADAAELEERHYTRSQAAERLGVERDTLDRAIARDAARKRAA
jgi:plasmid maintenance system antidote protein VapI